MKNVGFRIHRQIERAYCFPESLLAKSGVSVDEFTSMLVQFKQLLSRIHQTNEEAKA